MNSKIVAAALFFAATLSPTATAQEEVDRFSFCSRFPQNSKCEGFEAPVPLESRSGEETSCQLAVGEHRDNSKCKLNFGEDEIVFYQEQGDKIDQIDNKRASIEYIIPRENIAVFNHQIWGKINRWQITYISDGDVPQLNTLTILAKQETSDLIAPELTAIELNDSIDMVARTVSVSEESTDNPQLQELLDTKECVRCNLQNVDLSGMDLSEVNLEEANLQGANLSDTNLSFANLSSAYLVGANLSNADLTEANLGATNFTVALLSNANLEVTGLQAANFQGADLREANLQGAYLRAPAYLKEANLEGANLTEADLRGANLTRANLVDANLQGANLKDTNVELKDVPGNYTFGEAVLDQLIGVPIFGLSNKGVDFKTDLTAANLQGADLTGASLEEVAVTDANFDGANLTEAELEETDLTTASTCGTILPDGTSSDTPCNASSITETEATEETEALDSIEATEETEAVEPIEFNEELESTETTEEVEAAEPVQ